MAAPARRARSSPIPWSSPATRWSRSTTGPSETARGRSPPLAPPSATRFHDRDATSCVSASKTGRRASSSAAASFCSASADPAPPRGRRSNACQFGASGRQVRRRRPDRRSRRAGRAAHVHRGPDRSGSLPGQTTTPGIPGSLSAHRGREPRLLGSGQKPTETPTPISRLERSSSPKPTKSSPSSWSAKCQRPSMNAAQLQLSGTSRPTIQ